MCPTSRPAGRRRRPDAPLAARMRPRTLDEVVGQAHLLGRGTALRVADRVGLPHSMILYGPPGTGKTTLARIVAGTPHAAFEELSAVEAGRAEVREVLERAAPARDCAGSRTIFFLDEIHRFNKAQQDALLPAVEEGTIILIGATTENPYFEVNSALLSRTQVYELHALTARTIEVLLRRALDRERGRRRASVERRGARLPRRRARRRCPHGAHALELACATVDAGGPRRPSPRRGRDAAQGRAVRQGRRPALRHDLRLHQVHARLRSRCALYYLAVMLEGGEDPRFIARRMVILASEDVGNADPQALPSWRPPRRRGRARGDAGGAYALAQATIYLALAPKSKAAYHAIARARPRARGGAQTPPAALRSAAYPGADKLGRGSGYEYPHSRPGHQRAGAPARGARRPALLRARRRRGGAARAARGDPPGPRARGIIGSMADSRITEASPSIESRSPAGGVLLGMVPRATRRDVGAAVDRAAEVQRLWATLRLQDRARYMARAAQAVIDEVDELVDLISREQGRPRAEVEVVELLPAVETLQWLAERGPGILAGERIGFSRTQHPVKRGRWTYEPLGVVAVLGPAAEPFATPLGDVAVALMAGNGVVLQAVAVRGAGGRADRPRVRPRRAAPRASCEVVPGLSPTSAAALVDAPVAQVRFTGSASPGARWPSRARARSSASSSSSAAMRRWSRQHQPRTASRGITWAAFANAGQSGGGRSRPSTSTRSPTSSSGRLSRPPERCASATRPIPPPTSARWSAARGSTAGGAARRRRHPRRDGALRWAGAAHGVSGAFFAPVVLTSAAGGAPGASTPPDRSSRSRVYREADAIRRPSDAPRPRRVGLDR